MSFSIAARVLLPLAALLLFVAAAGAQGLGDPLAPAAPTPAGAGVEFDHSAFTALLEEFVEPSGLVDYAGWQARGRERLDAYLRSQQEVSAAGFAGWSPPARDAFWINAYNAWTVRLILGDYPVDSIKDLGGFLSSVFSKRFVPLQHLSPRHRKPLSLGEIEHEILAAGAAAPEFHFGIVCASRSCPPLRREAYVASRLEAQLADQARRFLADPRRNDSRPAGGTLRISKIFDWAEDDFAARPGGVRGLLRDFGPLEMLGAAGAAPVRIRYRDYDWSLNAWRPEK
ncbi:MAG TPA: DUF547 domain-containing protein [Planctomycetota bacterium]